MPALNPSDRTMPVIAGNYLRRLAGDELKGQAMMPCILIALPNPGPSLMAGLPESGKTTGDQPD
jgi:hypothetical protein